MDREIEDCLVNTKLDLMALNDEAEASGDAEIIMIATPTNYDPKLNFFDTSSVEHVLDVVSKINPNATVVIKPTVPGGYTATVQKRYPQLNILFSPEFLCEGKALYDNLHPSRIIVGAQETQRIDAETFAGLLKEASLEKNTSVVIMPTIEAIMLLQKPIWLSA